MTWCADRDSSAQGAPRTIIDRGFVQGMGWRSKKEGPLMGLCALEPAASAAPEPSLSKAATRSLVRGAWLTVPQRSAFPRFPFCSCRLLGKAIGLSDHRCFPARIHAESEQPSNTVGGARVYRGHSPLSRANSLFRCRNGRSVCATRSRRNGSLRWEIRRRVRTPRRQKRVAGGNLAVSLVSTWGPDRSS